MKEKTGKAVAAVVVVTKSKGDDVNPLSTEYIQLFIFCLKLDRLLTCSLHFLPIKRQKIPGVYKNKPFINCTFYTTDNINRLS